jgi:hypothetical protein
MRTFAFVFSLVFIAGCNDSNSNKQNQAIGTACTTSGQCGTGAFFCDLDHPNGYCKRDCHADADCPTGSVCAGAGMVSPGACHKTCPKGASDCRTAEGYVCKVMPDDASAQYCDVPEAAGDGGA